MPTLRCTTFTLLMCCTLHAQSPTTAPLHPYTGPSLPGVDCSTLTHKIMCGYQGWFTTTNDGSAMPWWHYGKAGGFAPGHCGIDVWPDVSELSSSERYDTPFHNADGSTAQLFSDENAATVDRHFAWMQQYGIDGVFVQRFASDVLSPVPLHHVNTVLDHCRSAANQHGRVYAVMYDLSGLHSEQLPRLFEDWKSLVTQMKLTRDPADHAYLHHLGKPVVAIWGVGFNDHRKYNLDDCATFIRFLKSDPTFGNCTIMLGVPTYWRTLDRDAQHDPHLPDVLQLADIISPWTVGRYDSPDSAAHYAQTTITADLAWCDAHHLQYMPVAFPGFSWHNLNPKSRLDEIPRLKGQFLWTQYIQAKKAGATMVYQAMFDEVNEGTAIFKCTNTPPAGANPFLTYEGLPSDHYLWLVGQAQRMLDDQLPASETMPARVR